MQLVLFARSHSRRLRRRLSLAALALTLAACAAPWSSEPVLHERGVLLQRVDAVLARAQLQPGLRLQVTPSPIATGQALSVEVQADQPGYLYIYQVSTDGRQLTLVFPNAMDGAHYVAAGLTTLPRAHWQLMAHGPAGVGYLLALLTQQPGNGLTLLRETQQGIINPPRPYAAALATLHEITP